MRVLVVNHISLDGVLQGPGRPDEDIRDGFQHGGWAQQGNDPAMGAAMSERMGRDFSWLFGRRSYDGMLTYWNQAGGPFKDGLNQTRKYVASSTPTPICPGQTRRSSAETFPPKWCASGAARRQPRDHGQRSAHPVAAPTWPHRRAVPDDPPARARLGPPAVRFRRRSATAAAGRLHADGDRSADGNIRTGPTGLLRGTETADGAGREAVIADRPPVVRPWSSRSAANGTSCGLLSVAHALRGRGRGRARVPKAPPMIRPRNRPLSPATTDGPGAILRRARGPRIGIESARCAR